MMTNMLLQIGYAMRDLPYVFKHRSQPVSYDELFKDPKDGCARYDDVWGG